MIVLESIEWWCRNCIKEKERERIEVIIGKSVLHDSHPTGLNTNLGVVFHEGTKLAMHLNGIHTKYKR